jgi:iron complex outermembrane receptor protein
VRPRQAWIVAAALALVTTSVHAQESAEPPARAMVEEIVVTARKRAESIQDVPLSVSAFSAEDLVDAGFDDLASVARFTPNLWFETTDPSRSFIFIRGIGTRQYDSGSDPSVGVFVDGVYQGRFGGLDPDLLTVERIEVLKGPQGTLYGRNTIGGALSVVTAEPSEDDWSGRAFVEGGASMTPGDGFGKFAAHASGPVVADALATSLAFSYRNREGFTRVFGEGVRGGSDDSWTLKTKTKWTALDRLSFVLNATATNVHAAPVTFVFNDLGDPTTPIVLKSPLAPQPEFSDDPYETFGNLDTFLRREAYAASVTTNWGGDVIDVTAITAFQAADLRELADEGTALDVIRFPVSEEQTQFSQELRADARMGAFSVMAGLYYGVEWSDRTDVLLFGRDSILALANLGRPVNYTIQKDIEAVGYAAFGQLQWDVTERFHLTGGLRVSRDEKDADFDARDDAPALEILLESYRFSTGKGWTSVDPLVSVAYDVFDDTMAYATWSTGFKAGAFQWAALTEATARQIVDPERVQNYEIGLKSAWLDRRVKTNLSLFWMDYTDLQQFRVVQESIIPTTVQANAAQSTIRGVELDATALLREWLSVDFAYAFLDAVYDEFLFDPSDPNSDFSGNHLPRSPKHSASVALNVSRSFPLADLAGRLSYSWRDSFFWEADNNRPARDQEEGALGLLDASIRLTRGSLSLSFWGTNLTNEAYRVHIIDWGFDPVSGRPNAVADIFAPPRTLGARLEWRFG